MTWVYAAVLALLLALGGWGAWERHEAQIARQQLADYKTSQVAAVARQEQIYLDRALAQEKANAATLSNLQAALDGSDARGTDLARRLRLAAVSGRCPVPQADHQPGAAEPAREPSSTHSVDEALARYDAACQRDAGRLQSLIEEIKPQL